MRRGRGGGHDVASACAQAERPDAVLVYEWQCDEIVYGVAQIFHALIGLLLPVGRASALACVSGVEGQGDKSLLRQ